MVPLFQGEVDSFSSWSSYWRQYEQVGPFKTQKSKSSLRGGRIDGWTDWFVQVLSDNNSGEEVDEEWPVIGQFSSVGSLGPSSSSWLCSEWLLSLSSTKKKAGASLHKYPNLKLVKNINCRRS